MNQCLFSGVMLLCLALISSALIASVQVFAEECSVTFIPQVLTIELDGEAEFGIKPCRASLRERRVQLVFENEKVVKLLNSTSLFIAPNSTEDILLKSILWGAVLGHGARHERLLLKVMSAPIADVDQNDEKRTTDDVCPEAVKGGIICVSWFRTRNPFILITVVHSRSLEIVIQACGWIYFIAWSVSFYPQIFLNWYRRSVVGLNFDFLAFNFTGFLFYAIFNCAFYFIPTVQTQYFAALPHGVNPVQINDVVFALHALLATSVTIIQCFFYECSPEEVEVWRLSDRVAKSFYDDRKNACSASFDFDLKLQSYLPCAVRQRGGQRLSITCLVLLSIGWLFALISMATAFAHVLSWLLFVLFLSYVKLIITLIKYIPQAYSNYRRKSTIGWSIGNVLLDFTGGMMSVLQMLILAYNHDDWQQIFGDFTKFGLGFISLLFDILFILQHYVFYRFSNYEPTTASFGSSIEQLVK
ncbi:unnamed protein product [Soboliphyme baturini]|uniref:Cystinosin-like protein n=1 Tax=Soboliphyme baturini TaxID=241478 RepID=A0A183IDA0_9BILA|nr:unnamed protein product [Soboliphyme baturini]